MDISRPVSARIIPPEIERRAPDPFADAILTLTEEGIVLVGDDDVIERWNRAAEAITGYTAQSVVGRKFGELIADRYSNPYKRLRGGVATVLDFRLRSSRDEDIMLTGAGVPLQYQKGRSGWIWVFRHAHTYREIEQLKSEFVSTVSHELKTPLASIKAYTATLRTNPNVDGEMRSEFLAVIEQETDRLTRLIEDLFVVSRVQASLLLKRRETVALSPLITRVLENVQIDWLQHPVDLTIGDVTVSGDSDRLYEVLFNLIDNAVKYSPEGGTITVRAAQDENATRISVADSGIGVPADKLPFIFDKFYRVEEHLTSSTSGSGLGLFIIHSIVRAHGGTITVESEVGKGTTFTLLLPART